MIESLPAYPLDYVSVLVSVQDCGRPLYQGTAFPFLRPGRWLTAAHCVHDWRGPDTLALIQTRPGNVGIDSITRVETHPELDLGEFSRRPALPRSRFPRSARVNGATRSPSSATPKTSSSTPMAGTAPAHGSSRDTSSGSSSQALKLTGKATSS